MIDLCGRDTTAGRHRAAGRVLVVDDGLLARQLAKTLLEQAGFDVEMAADGPAALASCRSGERYDLILMDLDIPVMDGLAAAAALRELGSADGGGVPIVFASGLPEDQIRANATDAGMDGYIVKPYDPRSFAADVQQALTKVAPSPRRPVWNHAFYTDLAELIGADRVAAHLGLFEDELCLARTALAAHPEDHGRFSKLAHRLVPAASLLGFEDLTAACTNIQTAAVCHTCAMGTTFAAAVDAALAALPGVRIKVAASSRPSSRT